jgi:hypothetical protein
MDHPDSRRPNESSAWADALISSAPVGSDDITQERMAHDAHVALLDAFVYDTGTAS